MSIQDTPLGKQGDDFGKVAQTDGRSPAGDCRGQGIVLRKDQHRDDEFICPFTAHWLSRNETTTVQIPLRIISGESDCAAFAHLTGWSAIRYGSCARRARCPRCPHEFHSAGDFFSGVAAALLVPRYAPPQPNDCAPFAGTALRVTLVQARSILSSG